MSPSDAVVLFIVTKLVAQWAARLVGRE